MKKSPFQVAKAMLHLAGWREWSEVQARWTMAHWSRLKRRQKEKLVGRVNRHNRIHKKRRKGLHTRWSDEVARLNELARLCQGDAWVRLRAPR